MAYESVAEIHSAGDRAFLKSILDADGIPYFIQGEHAAPYFFHALPMRLMVRKEYADRARALLEDIGYADSAAGDYHKKDAGGKY